MRRPFILFLILITFYCWLTDCVNFLFYLFGNKSTNTATYCTFIGLFLFVAVLYTLKVTIFKKIETPGIKEIFQPDRKKEWLLLFFVSLPLIILGLFRSIYPDQNFDTTHYELYLQEFDYVGTKSDFAPGTSATYIFHLSQKIYGLSRHALGYRLGPLFSIFLLIAIIASSYDLIKKFLSVYAPEIKVSIVLPALFALYAVFSDDTLIGLGTYKTDLIGIPLLLELLYMVFFGGRYSPKVNYLIFFILSSLTIALKLTFLPYVALLGLIYFIKHFKRLSPALLFSIPFVIFFFPSIPLLYSFIETGNPLFPFFNKIFHSPFYPNVSFKDERWGPRNGYETLFYHITTLMDPPRRNEWSLYSYRLLIGFFISLGVITFYLLRLKKNRHDKLFQQIAFLSIVALLFDFLWIIAAGTTRYDIIVEVSYALVIGLLVIYLKERIVSVFLVFAILFQFYNTFQNICIAHTNLSWYNYQALFQNKDLRQDNIKMMLHDHGRITDNSHILPTIDAFLTVGPCVPDGFAKLVNKKAAIYDLAANRTVEYVDNFERTVVRSQTQNKTVMAIGPVECMATDFINNLNKKGFLATDMYEIYPDFLPVNEPVFLFKIRYLDTSKYTIHSISKHVVVGNSTPSDSIFTYKSDQKVRAFIREAPYIFDWTLDVYDLYVNDKKYIINSKSKDNKIISLDTNTISVRANHPKNVLVIIQEIEEKKQ